MKTKLALFSIFLIASPVYCSDGGAWKESSYAAGTPKNIIEKVNNKVDNQSNQYNNVYQNILYELKEILPIIEEQMLICTDGNKVWLEFTNYEFLINGKESNNIVKVYVGSVHNSNLQNIKTKQVIEIFDPETAYVFMKAVLRYWDDISENCQLSSPLHLAKTLQVGYQAVCYHFGFSNSLEVESIENKIHSFGELIEFWQSLQKKYVEEARGIGRLVAFDEIRKRKSLDLIAYYPNPVYLEAVAVYKRPIGMGYEEYIKYGIQNLQNPLPINCSKTFLTKSQNIKLDSCDKYSEILEKIYPDDICYLNNSRKFHFSDFNPVKNVYAFRGDSRSIDDIYDADGFWPLYSKELFNKNKEQVLGTNSAWKMSASEEGGVLSPRGEAYVSTSKILTITSIYGNNVYVVLIPRGLILPQDVNGKKIYDVDLREIAVPGEIDWKNVIGARERRALSEGKGKKWYRRKHHIGPVYLKENFATEDPKNFWEVLQIMGGKSQCFDSEFILNIAKTCLLTPDNPEGSNVDKLVEEFVEYYRRVIGVSKQEMQDPGLSLRISRYVKNWHAKICQDALLKSML